MDRRYRPSGLLLAEEWANDRHSDSGVLNPLTTASLARHQKCEPWGVETWRATTPEAPA